MYTFNAAHCFFFSSGERWGWFPCGSGFLLSGALEGFTGGIGFAGVAFGLGNSVRWLGDVVNGRIDLDWWENCVDWVH